MNNSVYKRRTTNASIHFFIVINLKAEATKKNDVKASKKQHNLKNYVFLRSEVSCCPAGLAHDLWVFGVFEDHSCHIS